MQTGCFLYSTPKAGFNAIPTVKITLGMPFPGIPDGNDPCIKCCLYSKYAVRRFSVCCDQVIVDGMEYQPCVASGSKKAARAEAALICLQELAALPADQTVPPQPQAIPPVVVPTGAPRLVPRLPQPPKPVCPLMSLQPRPQFASLPSFRPLNPSTSTEPPPPGVDVSDFTSDVFDDLRKFETTLMPTDRPPENSESSQPENAFAQKEHHMLGVDAEGSNRQFEEDSFVTSDTVGLLGDAPQELEAVRDEYVDIPLDFSTAFERPGERFFPEFQDFTEDTFINDGPGILGEYHEEFEPLEEDLQSAICFQDVVGFGRRSMLPALRLMQRPFCTRGPRMSQIACPSPRIPQRFSRGPLQRFPRPFNVPSPCCPTLLPRGVFRPRVRPFIRPLPFTRPH